MRKIQLMLIKPSRYHDDGYVIRWWRAMVPLAADCAERQVLGPSPCYYAVDQVRAALGGPGSRCR